MSKVKLSEAQREYLKYLVRIQFEIEQRKNSTVTAKECLIIILKELKGHTRSSYENQVDLSKNKNAV